MPNPGPREFAVSTLRTFWQKYQWCSKNRKHFYEVLPEDRPCRLFLDVEYSKSANASLDGEAMMVVLKRSVSDSLKDEFQLVHSTQTFLELDASTATKFSRHLIYHLESSYVFESVRQLGNFVKKYGPSWDGALEQSGYGVLRADGTVTSFVDKGVYHRRQNFRLWLSSKPGKNNPLELSPCTTLYWHLPSEILVFQASLVMLTSQQEFQLLPLVTLPVVTAGPAYTVPISTSPAGAPTSMQNGGVPEVIGGRGCSKFKQLEAFLLGHIGTFCQSPGAVPDGSNPCITGWKKLKTPDGWTDLITFDIGGNRFCHNISRPHKSNHVYWCVDVRHGVFYQKCHDPVCAEVKFKSADCPLPPELWALSRVVSA